MEKKVTFIKTYFMSVVIVGLVVFCCIYFLLDNLPYNNSYLDVELDTQKIVISNKLLMSDFAGKKLNFDNKKSGTNDYIEFEIKSKAKGKLKYEIYLTKENADAEIPQKFVKVYLTDENDFSLMDTNELIPTYYDLKVADSNLSGKLLYSGVFKDNESKKFRLRMWVADTYEIKKDLDIFSVKLNIDVK